MTDSPEPNYALITMCPDGPLLVRGAVDVVDHLGNAVPAGRRTIALCRCGKTRIAPFCDGTHKLRRTNRTAEERPSDEQPKLHDEVDED